MKQIIKSKLEPQVLIDYRNDRTIEGELVNYTWKEFQKPWKENYKKYLLQEQGYICAYCMKRISENEMKIEHLNPRHTCKTEAEKLADNNMVAVCIGVSGAEHHCDTKRGELTKNLQILSMVPIQSEPSCENLTFFVSGEFKSKEENEEIERDINLRLNLNCNPLKTGRNATEQGFIEGLITKAFDGGFEWTIDLLTAELNNLLQLGVNFENRRFNEFCLIEVNVLNQKIEFRKTA